MADSNSSEQDRINEELTTQGLALLHQSGFFNVLRKVARENMINQFIGCEPQNLALLQSSFQGGMNLLDQLISAAEEAHEELSETIDNNQPQE